MVTVTVVQTKNSVDQNKFIVEGTLTLTANYGGAATHGDTINMSALGVPSNAVPDWVQIQEATPAGTAPTGYLFIFCPGTTQANGVLSIWNNVTEYTEGSAYSAGLLAAVLEFRAEFPAFL